MFGDEIWDENQWESFLKKDDDRVARYMKLFNQFLAENPLPNAEDEQGSQLWKDSFKAYLIQHGLPLEEFESNQYQNDDEERLDNEFRSLDLPEDDLILDEDREAFEALLQIPVYQNAYDLTTRVLAWSDSLPGAVKDSELVQFCSSVMQTTANVAKGHGMGYEREVLGGNIACLKRAIQSANNALDLLMEMKSRPYFSTESYANLYESAYEVRNGIGLYIQELRDKFNLGID